MKKMLLLLAVYVMVVNMSFAQPAIPNGGFENWTDTITPQNWSTTNLNLGFFTYAAVTRTTDKYTGTYAMKLRTINIPLFGKLPGVATTGNLDLTGGSGITGGGTYRRCKTNCF